MLRTLIFLSNDKHTKPHAFFFQSPLVSLKLGARYLLESVLIIVDIQKGQELSASVSYL
jgi:hypothetical protein